MDRSLQTSNVYSGVVKRVHKGAKPIGFAAGPRLTMTKLFGFHTCMASLHQPVHLGLLRRHHCLGSAKCGHPDGVLAHVRKMPRSKRSRVVIGGTDRRRVEDPTGLLTEWRATEAEMQTLAKRATVSGLQVQFFEWF